VVSQSAVADAGRCTLRIRSIIAEDRAASDATPSEIEVGDAICLYAASVDPPTASGQGQKD
jgi:hypothetical protein